MTNRNPLVGVLSIDYDYVLKTNYMRQLRTALVLGATGAIGRELVAQLLEDHTYTQVQTFVRRSSGITHPRLVEHVVDLSNPEAWAECVRGHVAFCTIGTTLSDAGSKEAQWVVDYDYPVAFARMAKAGGVQSFVLVSSMGASVSSRFFYLRMKGQMEQAIRGCGFTRLVIARPPLLIRPGTDRLGERIALPLMRVLNAVGLFRSRAPMHTADVARALIALDRLAPEGETSAEAQTLKGYL